MFSVTSSRNVVAAYVALIAAMPRLPVRFTLNIASSRARPLSEFVDILREAIRVPFEIVVDPARVRPVDVPLASGCNTRLHAATGWAPKISIERTIRDLLENARAQVR